MENSAKVLKVSQSGKSIFVRCQRNAFDTKGIAGYCSNPEGKYKEGDIIPNFPTPTGIEHRTKPDSDEIMCTESGEPLSFLVW